MNLTKRIATTIVLSTAVVLAALGVQAQTAPTGEVTYLDAAKTAELFAGSGSLGKGQDFSASVSVRTAAGQVEVHNKETDVIYFLDGEATFVTGGTMVDGKLSRPEQYLGVSITGGQEHQVKKGDFIVVPAGTPHWFKQVPKSVRYYVVKSIRP